MIKNFAFSPATLTVKTGSTVTWTNQDAAPHQVASDGTRANLQISCKRSVLPVHLTSREPILLLEIHPNTKAPSCPVVILLLFFISLHSVRAPHFTVLKPALSVSL
jgi:hypothetical protein